MQIKILNPTDDPNWNDRVAELPGATIFHTANWAKVLSDSYRYRPVYISAFQDKSLVGVLPLMDVKSILTGRRGVSLPFTDQCHAIFTDAEVFKQLWEYAVDYGSQQAWKYIELRGELETFDKVPKSGRFIEHTLNLIDDQKQLINQFRGSTHRNIKRAEKNGIKVRLSYSYSDLKTFYNLNCLTRKEHGLPPQPFNFFKHLFRQVIGEKFGFIVIAELGEKPIAGAMYLHFKKQGVYKYGASDRHYQNLRANNLVMWKAIQWFAENKFWTLSFGRTETHHEGLLQFKRGWGTIESDILYYRYEAAKNCFLKDGNSLKSSYWIFRVQPIFMSKVAGRLLYKHVG